MPLYSPALFQMLQSQLLRTARCGMLPLKHPTQRLMLQLVLQWHSLLSPLTVQKSLLCERPAGHAPVLQHAQLHKLGQLRCDLPQLRTHALCR
jgi:hypothetical protein